jgi:methylphosphotriester-DNA--protein-cysteine methyltransferase
MFRWSHLIEAVSKGEGYTPSRDDFSPKPGSTYRDVLSGKLFVALSKNFLATISKDKKSLHITRPLKKLYTPAKVKLVDVPSEWDIDPVKYNDLVKGREHLVVKVPKSLTAIYYIQKDGLTVPEAAKKVGVDPSSIRRSLQRRGIKATEHATKYVSRMQKAVKLVKNGMPVKDAAAKSGIGPRGVYATLKKAGHEFDPRRSHTKEKREANKEKIEKILPKILSNEISLRAAAKEVGMSPSVFDKYIKRKGITREKVTTSWGGTAPWKEQLKSAGDKMKRALERIADGENPKDVAKDKDTPSWGAMYRKMRSLGTNPEKLRKEGVPKDV